MRRLALTLCIALPFAAQAQQPPARPPTATPATTATPDAPDRTTASFGDWNLRCETLRPQGQPATRVCEIQQALQDQRGQPILQVVLGRPARGEPLRLIVQVPLEVRVDAPLRLIHDPAAPAAEALSPTYRMCSAQRGGCFAELDLRDDAAIRRLPPARARRKPGPHRLPRQRRARIATALQPARLWRGAGCSGARGRLTMAGWPVARPKTPRLHPGKPFPDLH